MIVSVNRKIYLQTTLLFPNRFGNINLFRLILHGEIREFCAVIGDEAGVGKHMKIPVHVLSVK